jgi:hypothetical protein
LRATLPPARVWPGSLHYHEVEQKPTEKAEDVPAGSSYRRLVIFYAVVSDESEQVIEFFKTPSEAELTRDPSVEI